MNSNGFNSFIGLFFILIIIVVLVLTVLAAVNSNKENKLDLMANDHCIQQGFQEGEYSKNLGVIICKYYMYYPIPEFIGKLK